MTELLVDEITHYFIRDPTTQSSTNYRQFLFNLTYHRHQTSGTNYENAITKEDLSGGTALNCILDFNGGDFSWRYDNGNHD